MDKNGDGFVTKTVKTSGLRTDKTRKFSGVQKCVSEPDNGSGGDCLPPVWHQWGRQAQLQGVLHDDYQTGAREVNRYLMM